MPAVETSHASMGPLTDRDRQMLELERLRFRHLGYKEQLIREQFGVSPVQYLQRLLAIIEHPDALAYDAQLVNRLRRLRDKRAAQRRFSRKAVGPSA